MMIWSATTAKPMKRTKGKENESNLRKMTITKLTDLSFQIQMTKI